MCVCLVHDLDLVHTTLANMFVGLICQVESTVENYLVVSIRLYRSGSKKKTLDVRHVLNYVHLFNRPYRLD